MIMRFAFFLMIAAAVAGCGDGSNKGVAVKPGEEPAAVQATEKTTTPQGQPIHLSQDEFIEKVFDFRGGGNWLYKGDKPCIVDFYADWCGPCRSIAPYMNEFAATYAGQIYVYKVNTDFAQELAMALGINSIPMVLMVPQHGDPMRMDGAMPKDRYESAIRQILLPVKS